jgi:uncharacterized protein Veg
MVWVVQMSSPEMTSREMTSEEGKTKKNEEILIIVCTFPYVFTITYSILNLKFR